MMAQARHWLYTLETRSDAELERIWPRFDAWYIESARHRRAYRLAQARYHQLTGIAPGPKPSLRDRLKEHVTVLLDVPDLNRSDCNLLVSIGAVLFWILWCAIFPP